MPKPTIQVEEMPDTLRPYGFHDVSPRIRGDEAVGNCPFCLRDGKFSINVASGQWRCFSCGGDTERGGGNAYTFLRKLHSISFEHTPTQDYADLAINRGYIDPQVLLEWGIARSIATGDWIVPGYSIGKGELVQVYRYIRTGDRFALLPTPTLGHTLFGMGCYRSGCETVDVCEGPWDGMALYELLSRLKLKDGKYAPTGNRAISLLSTRNVLAVPGCTTFSEGWLELLADKIVNLYYDNDHARKHPITGHDIPPAGLSGMQRVARMLATSKHPPKEVNYLCWHTQGYDVALPSGYDVRDLLTKG